MSTLFEPYRQWLPEISAREEDQYTRYYELLKEWNERMNLVSRKSFDRVVPSQFVDCIQIADLAFPYVTDLPVVDVGSGGGFPGLIFAIRYPQFPIGLFETAQKKRTFLEEVKAGLDLKHVSVRERFGGQSKAFVFARAVFSGEDYFDFFEEHLLSGSRLVRNLGSAGGLPLPNGFKSLFEKRYTLPDDLGERVVQILECST